PIAARIARSPTVAAKGRSGPAKATTAMKTASPATASAKKIMRLRIAAPLRDGDLGMRNVHRGEHRAHGVRLLRIRLNDNDRLPLRRPVASKLPEPVARRFGPRWRAPALEALLYESRAHAEGFAELAGVQAQRRHGLVKDCHPRHGFLVRSSHCRTPPPLLWPPRVPVPPRSGPRPDLQRLRTESHPGHQCRGSKGRT